MKSTQFLLASTSPRRIELLKSVGMSFRVVKPNIDEKALPRETPTKLVRRLSFEKASAALPRTGKKKALILAADTIVVLPITKKILGKPKNDRDAFKMLKSLCGKTHSVYTSFTLILAQEKKVVRSKTCLVHTKVTMRKFTNPQIKKYILSGEPRDKAGAYAAQGLGMSLISSISGSYTNVVGLPMSQLLEILENEFKYYVL